jgi:purine-binding chemotaxis protein CheW
MASDEREHAVDFAALRERLANAASVGAARSPEQARALLEQRARKLAERPAQASGVQPLELLCFRLAGERYAIETRWVLQVLALIDLTRLPGAPPHLLGVTNLRGQVLPVFDLRVLLGISRAALSDMSRLLVLGESGAELGILADSAEEIALIAPGDVLDLAQPLVGLERACVRGVTRDAWIVLSGAALLADRRLFLEDTPDERVQA